MSKTPAPAVAGAGVFVYPDSYNLLTATAELLSATLAPPDWSAATVIAPQMGLARELTATLANQHGLKAALAPRVLDLKTWAGEYQLPGDSGPTLHLTLADLLRQHGPRLFGNADPWRLAEELGSLFAELELGHCDPAEDLETFTRHLARAYGVVDRPAPLSREAAIVHEFWKRWREFGTGANAYLTGLRSAVTSNSSTPLILFGFADLRPGELAALEPLWLAGKTNLLIHSGSPLAARIAPELQQHPAADNAIDTFFSAVFDTSEQGLRGRALTAAQTADAAPIHPRIVEAHDIEHQAQLVALQVRHWLLDGRRQIQIVSESRATARRVRALLERANIAVNDRGGWALSTTRAATTLERWLQALEEDFAAPPLLDLLKAPGLGPEQLCGPGANTQSLEHAVWRFEQDIVRHEQVSRGIGQYLAALERRRERLQWPEGTFAKTRGLLARLEEAGARLISLQTSAQPLCMWLAALDASLTALGLDEGLARDPAGTALLDLLEELQIAVGDLVMQLDWSEFRLWLGRELEQAEFRPPANHGNEGAEILLGNLGQSAGQPAKSVIVADISERSMASAAHGSFFNDGVRGSLGLNTRADTQRLQRHRLRRLLSNAEECLLTWPSQGSNGTELLWNPVEILRTFLSVAWQIDCNDPELATLAARPETWLAQAAEIPTLAIVQPTPTLPKDSLPANLTARAHQTLINCPYKFLYGEVLGLTAPQELKELLEKSDFGSIVHDCLNRFGNNFGQAVTLANRAKAEALLLEIGQKVFARHVMENSWHAGWEQAWEGLIPNFLDWAIEHAEAGWRFEDGEISAAGETVGGHTLRGRIDRVDCNSQAARAIVDYKTGYTPKLEDILSGEDLQLASYALMAPDVVKLAYVNLTEQRPKNRVVGVVADEVDQLRQQAGKRLDTVLGSIRDGAGLPANGDTGSCKWCDFAGICRHETWSET